MATGNKNTLQEIAPLLALDHPIAKTITFTAPRHARAFFEAMAADNLDTGRPDDMEIIFNRRTRQPASTRRNGPS